MDSDRPYRLVPTCPESSSTALPEYLHRVREVAAWCEAAGHDSLLVHSDHRLLDPWVVAQAILQSTKLVRPIVTVQPIYMHPYAVARKVISLWHLYGRTVDLNLAAGAFRADLLALDDDTPHDERYRRLGEYGTVIRLLLDCTRPVEYHGNYYRIHKPRALRPPDASAQPRLFVAASSPAGRQTAALLQAHGVVQGLPGQPPSECVRLGVIARPTAEQAWEHARARFRTDPGGRLQQRLDLAWSDSHWQQQLQQVQGGPGDTEARWLQPFAHRQAWCPYLVGDYRTVARELRRLLQRGTTTFFLDTPASGQDLEHTGRVFARAWSRMRSGLAVTAS